jgi:hypothetical protein
MWAINDSVLIALAESNAWQESGLNRSQGFTPELIYGPKGKLPQCWGRTWESAEQIHSDLCFNMGGGMPISIIIELATHSENQSLPRIG